MEKQNNLFDVENEFYHTCTSRRISKFLAHYELYKKITPIQGAILEFGVFRGTSLIRWAHFRDLIEHNSSREIVGFDTFGEFPIPDNDNEKHQLLQWTSSAGTTSIEKGDLIQILEKKKLNENILLNKGRIEVTLPQYLTSNPSVRIALINLDTDIYSPTKLVLESLYDRVVNGGLILLDNYGVFEGESKAIDEFLSNNSHIKIKKLPFARTPSFIIKNE